MIKMPWGVEVVFLMFPNQAGKNINKYFRIVEDSLNDEGLTDTEMKLVAYATIRAETGTFWPRSERESRFNTLRIPTELTPIGEDSAYSLYEQRIVPVGKKNLDKWKIETRMGNTTPGDGWKYRGRGFVQLTGKTNYVLYGELSGNPDIVVDPDSANDPVVAAEILAAYLSHNLSAIRAALRKNDLRAVRKAVNGGSNGLDGFVEAYGIGAQATGGVDVDRAAGTMSA